MLCEGGGEEGAMDARRGRAPDQLHKQGGIRRAVEDSAEEGRAVEVWEELQAEVDELSQAIRQAGPYRPGRGGPHPPSPPPPRQQVVFDSWEDSRADR